MPEYKNRFASPNFLEETILGQEGNKIGAIRIKPSSVLWKPKGERQFYSVTLDDFADWITDPSTCAVRKWS
jgi:hypothetical protein